MNPKNTKKSPIHENADANITCDFGDISRLGVANQTHVHIHDSSDNQIYCKDATTVLAWSWIFLNGLEKHGNGMEFYTGSSVRTLNEEIL